VQDNYAVYGKSRIISLQVNGVTEKLAWRQNDTQSTPPCTTTEQFAEFCGGVESTPMEDDRELAGDSGEAR